MSNGNFQDVLYAAYGSVGPTVELILPAVLVNVITISGLIMNIFVVMVTAASKNLRSTTNHLLAMISCFEVLHQIGHCYFLFIAVSGINFVRIADIIYPVLPILFGVYAAMMAMVCIAFDRLFILFFEHFHEQLKKPIYLAIHLLICTGFGLFRTLVAYENSRSLLEMKTTGFLPDIIEAIEPFFISFSFLLNGISAIVYIAIWVAIQLMKVTEETKKRFLKSLIIILLVNIGGYISGVSLFVVLFKLQEKLNVIGIWYMRSAASILLNIGAGCNAPVLYVTSTHYRTAFKGYLPCLLGHMNQTTANNRVFDIVHTTSHLNPNS